MQSQDRSYFKSLKSNAHKSHKSMPEHPRKSVSTDNFGELFTAAYQSRSTMAIPGDCTNHINSFDNDVFSPFSPFTTDHPLPANVKQGQTEARDNGSTEKIRVRQETMEVLRRSEWGKRQWKYWEDQSEARDNGSTEKIRVRQETMEVLRRSEWGKRQWKYWEDQSEARDNGSTEKIRVRQETMEVLRKSEWGKRKWGCWTGSDWGKKTLERTRLWKCWTRKWEFGTGFTSSRFELMKSISVKVFNGEKTIEKSRTTTSHVLTWLNI